MPPQRHTETPVGEEKVANIREKLFLAAQAAEAGIKVFPGKEWAFHYPKNGDERREKLQGLLDGRYRPGDVVSSLKPDALIYNAQDLAEEDGLKHVIGRIRDVTARMAHFDYPAFAEFVAKLKGTDATVETAEALYDGIANSRIRSRMIEAYGETGRKQMETALRNDADRVLRKFDTLPRTEKVLEALKLDWLCEDLGYVGTEQRDQALAQLSADERELFKKLQGPYRDYIKNGQKSDYEDLVKGVHDEIPKIQAPEISPEERKEMSESMEELQEELDELKDKVGMPGMENDPAIPPDDQDEYHTPPTQTGESKERVKVRPIFEITPAGLSARPLTGHYCSGRKSYYDVGQKTWSKKKRLTAYNVTVIGDERQKISGWLDAGLKSIPLPNGYALDASSLQAQGANMQISRDQNGCFYIQADKPCSFSVEFLKEEPPFVGQPVTEDTSPIYRGQLSGNTEQMVQRLQGSPLKKAEQARQYLLANHFYPSGGDLQGAQALQYKLRKESSGGNYLQKLDQSEYLECYSANTLFIAMMRRAGVPARLVVGHMIQGAYDGKAVIDQSTGHAWAEVWDGSSWRRYDATPQPKSEDMKKPEKDEKDKRKSTPGDQADDNGIDAPQKASGKPGQGKPQRQKGLAQQVQEKVDQMMDAIQNEQMGEAQDNDVSQGQSEVDQAQDQLQQMEQHKQEEQQKVDQADSFKDLKDLQEEIKKDENLLDDMKKELEDKLEAKEKDMKEKLKEKLDQMVNDGFLDAAKRDELLKKLDEEADIARLDRLEQEFARERQLYDQYDRLRQEVMPLVERWFAYFAEKLPRKKDLEFDEDMVARQGRHDRRAMFRPRNLLFNTVRNPRVIKSSVEPRFIASIVIDVSGSMSEGGKLEAARKLLVFYSELFARISKEFGYIRFSIHIFSDSPVKIKGFEHDYDSPDRYDFDDRTRSTVKVRLMQAMYTRGGTNMLDAIRQAAKELTEETFNFPDHASALYFAGDGGDSHGNESNIRTFLNTNDKEHGFGEHMYSAIMLGDQSQKAVLDAIFGEEHTTVAKDFDALVDESMAKFDDDITFYMQNKMD